MQRYIGRESNVHVRNSSRRYFKRGISPNSGTKLAESQNKKEVVSKINPYLYNQDVPKNSKSFSGYHMGNDRNGRFSPSKECLFHEVQPIRSTNSRHFIADKRKKANSSFYKKILDIPNYSDMLLVESNDPKSKSPIMTRPNSKNVTKQAVPQVQSMNQSEPTVEISQNQLEELHYKMVQFQQKCKLIVKN